MELETLKDLYIYELQDLYSAEKQLTKALPKMAKAATSDRLADGFRMHLDQTEEHVNRLEQILESQDASTRGAKCKGMEGLIEEGEEMIDEDAEDEVRDAGLSLRPSVLSITRSPDMDAHVLMRNYSATPKGPDFCSKRWMKKAPRIRS